MAWHIMLIRCRRLKRRWRKFTKEDCHSERSEESSAIDIAGEQGEEDVSLSLNMTKG